MQHTITIKDVIFHTPTWVWILLIALVVMGFLTSKESPVKLSRMFITPLIFITWGLWTITTTLPHVLICLLSYSICIIPGILIGYILNKNFQHYFLFNSEVYKEKSYLPLIIVLINFVTKYTLNVILVFHQSIYITYSAINGLTVGLFFGGIIYTCLITSKLNHSSR